MTFFIIKYTNNDSISENFPISFLSNILVISCSVPALGIDNQAFSVDTVGDSQTAPMMYEPRHEKTGLLPMRKQRRRSASQ